MEEPNAVGHAFNIANSRAVTQLEAVQALAEAAGKKPSIVRIPRDRIYQLGGHPMGPNLYFGVYLDIPPITMIVTKAQRVIGFKATPLPEGFKDTYRWYVRHQPKRPIDWAFEDKLLAIAQAHAAAAAAAAAAHA
jgi:nucleoside-diphosphate-sugar epimerase